MNYMTSYGPYRDAKSGGIGRYGGGKYSVMGGYSPCTLLSTRTQTIALCLACRALTEFIFCAGMTQTAVSAWADTG